MKIIFGKENVTKDENIVFAYSDLNLENGFKKIYVLLRECVKCDSQLEFTTSDDCPAFGKKLKDIISAEFSKPQI